MYPDHWNAWALCPFMVSDDELVEANPRESTRKLVDPAPVVVAQHDALVELEYTIASVLDVAALIPFRIPLVRLKPQVADVERDRPGGEPARFPE